METALVEQAMHMALARRQPEDGLLHSDQGGQYVSDAHRALLETHHATVSTSAPGNSYDNAMKESCFATLKTECASQPLAARAQARTTGFEYRGKLQIAGARLPMIGLGCRILDG